MKKGLVLGKFLPLHKGHTALIDFALKQVDFLYIVIVAKVDDTIDISIRKSWLLHYYNCEQISVIPFVHELPSDGKYNASDSELWCHAIKHLVPDIDVFISSESYGDILAEFMNIEHILYQPDRYDYPVSGTRIRREPELYYQFLPDIVRDYYNKLR